MWLSGSGGAGKASLQSFHILWEAAPANERQSRCPLQPVLGAHV